MGPRDGGYAPRSPTSVVWLPLPVSCVLRLVGLLSGCCLSVAACHAAASCLPAVPARYLRRRRELVGSEGFAAALPLAASGPGEPFVTAAGVLGVMAMWRSFYCCFLDYWNFKSIKSNLRSNKPSDAYR